jgi:RNA polymerase sigma factor (sigma-70 family)
MNMNETDLQLLERYIRHGDEGAFAEVLRRNLDLVHSVALRHVRSPHLAEEISQIVFAALARHARRLTADTIVPAWLYQVARRTAISVACRESRRRRREQEAYELTAMNAPVTDWTQIGPLLDAAMGSLEDPDRTVVLLRYFENKSLREIGAAIGTSEDAAQKRAGRAITRLREFFARRGVMVTEGGLGAIISTHAIQAAPSELAAILSGNALVASSAPAVGWFGALMGSFLAMITPTKTAVTIAVIIAVAASTYFLLQPRAALPPHPARVTEVAANQKNELPGPPAEEPEPVAPAPAAPVPVAVVADPQAELGTTVTEMIRLAANQDMVGLVRNFMAPIANQTPDDREALAQDLAHDPQAPERMVRLLAAPQSLQGATPEYNDTGTQATYHPTSYDPIRPDGISSPMIFVKVAGRWYWQ